MSKPLPAFHQQQQAKAFARCAAALKLRQSGMSFREVGRQMEISHTRAYQLVWKAERILEAGLASPQLTPPVERGCQSANG